MNSSKGLLPLQRDLLAAFFSRTQDFFLTGGGALAGYYFGHRCTQDLDLFALPSTDLVVAARGLGAAAAELGVSCEPIQETPDFRRYSVHRKAEGTLVDLVIERAPQLVVDKPSFGGVRVDAIREIAANKLCAILGRTAPRDLVDLRVILSQGSLELEGVLRDAVQKDGAVDPATLSWVLSRFHLGGQVALPEGVDIEELDRFRDEPVERFAKWALPRE